ncbi:MAG: hypothetical protein R3F14_40400 [Polyangiaceae bacterium]
MILRPSEPAHRATGAHDPLQDRPESLDKAAPGRVVSRQGALSEVIPRVTVPLGVHLTTLLV